MASPEEYPTKMYLKVEFLVVYKKLSVCFKRVLVLY